MSVKAHISCLKLRKKIYDQVFYGEIIVLIIEGYLEFVIAFFLQVYSDQMSEWYYWLSVLVGFILYGLIPALIVWVSRNPK